MSNINKVVENQVLRGSILEVVRNAEPLGAGTEVINAALKKTGYETSKAVVLEHCLYLKDKGLVRMERMENKILDIVRDIAHITAKGIDVLEGTEIVEGIELD